VQTSLASVREHIKRAGFSSCFSSFIGMFRFSLAEVYFYTPAECTVHPASIGDLQQTLPLCVVQLPAHRDFTVNHVDPFIAGRRAASIFFRFSPVAQNYLQTPQGDILSLRIHAECYCNSSTQCGQEETVRTRTRIAASHQDRSIGNQLMASGFNKLSKAFSFNGSYCHV